MINKKKWFLPFTIAFFLCGAIAVAGKYNIQGALFGGKKLPLPDAKQELKKIYTLYSNADSSITMEGIIRFYDKEKNDALKEQTGFYFTRNKKNFYSRLDYLQTYCADSLLIQLDTINKFIVVSKINIEVEEGHSQNILPFERFMQDTSSFKITATIKEENDERIITIQSELNPEIKSTSLYYDPVTYKIKRAEVEWWKDPLPGNDKESENKIWLANIEYRYPGISNISVENSIKKIIIINKGQVQVTEAYKDYEVKLSF
ncbi:MAG TPA: hypothetical protein VFN30_04275 [Chitinophagaceae bacterium]|nr:hypothetical protein [Chitinophagaceae bacterium]